MVQSPTELHPWQIFCGLVELGGVLHVAVLHVGLLLVQSQEHVVHAVLQEHAVKELRQAQAHQEVDHLVHELLLLLNELRSL